MYILKQQILIVCSQFILSRPTSSDTQYSAHLGSRSSSFSSRARPTPDHRPVSLHYSSPSHSSHLSTEAPMSPVYNTPYTSVHCNGSVQRVEKAPLVKVNPYKIKGALFSFSPVNLQGKLNPEACAICIQVIHGLTHRLKKNHV